MKRSQLILWIACIGILMTAATYLRYRAFRTIHPEAPLWTFFFK